MNVRLTIDAIGQKGDGLAVHDGKAVFVDRALAGESVDVTLYDTADGIKRAHIQHIHTPSPLRQNPPCSFYDVCGGCQMQHLRYEAYCAWKTTSVTQTLQRHITVLPEPSTPVFIPGRTRRRVTFACLKTNTQLIIGYHKRRSKLIADTDHCDVVTPDLMALRDAIKPYLMAIIRDSRVCDVFLQELDGGVDCVITGPVGKNSTPDYTVLEACGHMLQATSIARISWRLKDRDKPDILMEKNPLFKKAGLYAVPIPPLAFMQPSRAGEQALVDTVLSYLPETLKTAADLFSGHGTFTGPLATRIPSVAAYENDTHAINALKKAGHKTAFVRDLFKNPLSVSELNTYDCVILDPPRAGAKEQSALLAQSRVKTVIYVSCNPSTFAKDAARLIEGGYTLRHYRIIDQFIWSTHCEIVAAFSRSSSDV